jgi:hypothetical protein
MNSGFIYLLHLGNVGIEVGGEGRWWSEQVEAF